MQGIEGAVAVVTGAAQGNGEAIALGLAAAGARVALCDLKEDGVARVAAAIRAAGGEAVSFACDVTEPEDCARVAAAALESFGAPADILVNNAGVVSRARLDAENFRDDWRAVIAVNATGSMNMILALLPHLRRTGGRIVNLASIMSVTAGPGLVAYAASKGAVLQMTRALANDLAADGVRVNALAPGVIETPMTEDTRANPEAIGRFMAHTPMRRPGKPQELVGPVLFLASEMSSYVTGALVPVDGGYLAA